MITIQHLGRDIFIKAPRTYKMFMDSIPNIRCPEKKENRSFYVTWRLPFSPVSSRTICEKFVGYDIPDVIINAARRLDIANFLKTCTNKLECNFNTRLKPWDHQIVAYNFLDELGFGMLTMDMGTGKSKVVIDLINNNQYPIAMIIAPMYVCSYVWTKQIELHGDNLNVIQLCGKDIKGRLKLLNDLRCSRHPSVVIINYESVWRKSIRLAINKIRPDCLILDESHKVKTPSSAVTKFIMQYSKKATHRFAMTGTPMPESVFDIYSQYRCIQPDVFGTSFEEFKSNYAIFGGFMGYEVRQYINQEDLARKYHSISYTVSKDVLDLPPTSDIAVDYDVDAKTAKMYGDMERKAVVGIKDKLIVAGNSLTVMLRLQQLACGHLGEEGFISNDRSKVLSEIISNIDKNEPIIIFSRFINDLTALRSTIESMGREYFEMSARFDDYPAWERSVNGIIGIQIQSGNMGLDLTKARYIIYYSKTLSSGEYYQSRSRANRPGQRDHAFYFHILARIKGLESIDHKIMTAIRDKKNIVDSIIEQYKEE